jgi:multidrug resistance efflux pump
MTPSPAPAEAPAASGDDPAPRRSGRANALVIGLGSALLLTGLGVVMHGLTTRSRDAVVDADMIALASPISGQLVDLTVDVGSAVRAHERLAQVQNPRASEAEVRQLRTARTSAEAALAQVEQELALQSRMVADFSRDANDQRLLDTARSRNDLDQLRAERAREQEEVAFSQRNVVRQEELYKAGAVAQNVVDRARTTLAQNRDELLAIEARIRAQTNRVEASARNLNLDRTRSDTDPQPRLQDARLRLARLQAERAGAQRRLQGLSAQLASAESLFAQQSQVWLKAPLAAVVWRVLARRGDTVGAQQPVLRLVNCASRWITTYVSESDLKRLRIGSRARIDLIGEALDLRGQVDLIRSGVGRRSGSDDDPGQLPINLARESQVRVRIDSDVPAPPRKLCYVGYSARVTFL